MNPPCSLPVLIAALILALTYPACGETPGQQFPKQVLDARQLDELGRSAEALAILEPLMHEAATAWSEDVRGIALNVLGSIYRDLDRYSQARHCYEESIHILSQLPDEQRETASAINNLGGVEELSGQLGAAKALRLRALHLYEKTGNRAGIALASSNLTNIALKQNDLSAARKWMNKALDQLPRAVDVDEGNLAAIFTVKGALARSEGNFAEAIKAYQHAIELMTEACGPDCPKLGSVYTLRAETYGLSGNYQQAQADFQKALVLLKAGGLRSRRYLLTELAYASMLQAAGSQLEAARLKTEAQAALENLRRVQCNGCTITAESFR
ncbi:MAG TPA: tetratricopeptide repeat protein [Edaphobacter sp.]|nr:tetratricopeptide repeat protein [Edaphobacter sp.]